MIYVENDSLDPFFNLAVEEVLATAPTFAEPILLLWRNSPAVVVGVHQNAAEEIDRAFVEARGIAVVRRTTGGGAVYHDPGNLNYSFIVPDSTRFLRSFCRDDADERAKLDFPTDANDGLPTPSRRTLSDSASEPSENAEPTTLAESFSGLVRPILDVLRDLGVPAETSGRNDITVCGKKISGSAQSRKNGRTLHHGTLIFSTNVDDAARALTVDPSKFRSKAAKSTRARIGRLVDFLPPKAQVDALERFKNRLLKRLRRRFPLTVRPLTDAERNAARKLADEKYSTWDWNFGTSPKFGYRNGKRFDWGKFELAFDVEKGRIARARFFGDFFETRDLAELVERLIDVPFERAAVAARLDDAFLRSFLPYLTKDDFLSLAFGDV